MDDDIEALMPRTKAANDRAPVDAAKLKQYMATQKNAHSVGARSGVVVRGDVRKDAEGFEDIDDFWVDGDSMQDDSVDDDDSLTGSDKESADTSGDVSEPSEHEVELPEIDSPRSSDRESMDIERGSIPPQTQRINSARVEQEEKKEDTGPPPPASPVGSDVSFDFGGSPHGSVDMNADLDANVNVTVRDRRSKKSIEKENDGGDKEKTKAKAKARRRESFGARGFDKDTTSPFSLNEGPVTPLSNASDRSLQSIPSFSDKNSLSPNISKELFKKNEYASDASDGKPKKKQAKGKKAKKTTAGKQSINERKKPRIRPTGKYGYRTTPGTDTSTQSVQTDDDNDESFEAQNDSGGETGDDSFYNEPDAPTGPVRDRLPDASKILDDDENGDAWDGSGLRRSKRKRFKPLAWFKSEHMVYERTFVGVGTVMPTVVGVERLGQDSPTSKRTRAKPPSKRTNNSRALARTELPKDLQKRIIDSEWATLYDSQAGCMNDLNVICRFSEIRLRKLPTEERGGAVVHAYAGQSFNLFSPSPFARWISGRVVLPPGAWKEPEGVGQAVQLFYVTGCQPKSLELALAPETDDDFFESKHTMHFLLSPGDEFYVPSGNVYYVKNHSATADCDLRFTILKPEAPQVASDDYDSDADVEKEKEKAEQESKPEATEAASSPLKRKREEDASADVDSDSV
ncbi:Centromere protein C/Mif2/cnp3 [Phytophthora cinnamomi]|uniref:Centromere protein C/Mif2/cnp3 n=1 Tax=Phytophthora cinnamomi TaxID=4785 RepID=UPI003559A29A|nr:Centromere protein C/Mif2/cnp3 [Phytophthora cinnamomi]